MSNYIISNDSVRIVPESSINISQKLPLGTYTVEAMPMTGELFLKRTTDFIEPTKVYGDANKQSDRIITTFEHRDRNTGVLLGGEKGSGKTFIAKFVSWKLRLKNYSTILVNDQYDTVSLSQLIQNITEPCLIIFDEFEKIYSKNTEEDMKDPQTGLLTLLDGLFITKKLFIFTCNECDRVSTMLKNRPGRIFYNIEFGGLNDVVIESYCKANLKNKTHLKEILSMKKLFGKFTFDMLQALVEEVNRYDESPLEAVKMMNIIPENAGDYYFVKVTDIEKGFEYDNHFSAEKDNSIFANLFAEKAAKLTIWKPTKNDDTSKAFNIVVGIKDLYEQNENSTTYIVGKKYKVEFTLSNRSEMSARNLWKFADPYGI